MEECPTCGRDDFSSEFGIKQHHAKVHDESLTKVTEQCPVCGSDFEREKSREDRTTCSNECSAEYRSEKFSGEDSWHWKGGKETLECDFCGEDFERHTCNIRDEGANLCGKDCEAKYRSENIVGENHPKWVKYTVCECAYCGKEIELPPSYAADYENHFCTQDCMSEYNSKKYRGENNPNYNRITVSCSFCGDTKDIIPSHTGKTDNYFCGEKCRNKWLSANYAGESNPMYAGGHENYYGKNWQEQREKRLKIDGYQCRACGMDRHRHKEKHGKDLEIHHIKRKGDFEKLSEANKISNLVTTCHDCHRRFEGLPVFPIRDI